MVGYNYLDNPGYNYRNVDPYGLNSYDVPGMPYSNHINMFAGEPLFGRMQKSWSGALNGMYSDTDVNFGIQNNASAIAGTVSDLEGQNSIFKRLTDIGRGDIPNLLNTGDPVRTLGAVLEYGKRKENPDALIEDVEDVWNWGFASAQHNKNLEHIADASIKVHDDNVAPEVAARLIKESGDWWGANTELIEKLLVDSSSSMNEVQYNRFIHNIEKKFTEVSGGQSLTNFMKNNYARLGMRFFGISFLGTNEKGKQFIRIIQNARNSDEGSTGMTSGVMPYMMLPAITGMAYGG